MGLSGVDHSWIVIGYEPIWSIGPGKTPADKPYIEKNATVLDPPCLPQDWDSLYDATLDSIRHPIGMPMLTELAHKAVQSSS